MKDGCHKTFPEPVRGSN